MSDPSPTPRRPGWNWRLYAYAAWAGIVGVAIAELIATAVGGGTIVLLAVAAAMAVIFGYFAEPVAAWLFPRRGRSR